MYCGPVHRRVAEYQLRSVQSLLRRALQKRQDAGLQQAHAVQYGQKEAERAVTYWQDEVKRLDAELERLLKADPGSAEPASGAAS